jgi:hypothetical protein
LACYRQPAATDPHLALHILGHENITGGQVPVHDPVLHHKGHASRNLVGKVDENIQLLNGVVGCLVPRNTHPTKRRSSPVQTRHPTQTLRAARQRPALGIGQQLPQVRAIHAL